MNKRNWMITGGCGFIGTRLVSALKTRDVGGIRIVDNLAVGTQADLSCVTEFDVLDPRMEDYPRSNRQVQLLVADINDSDTMLRAARGQHVVVHLAANAGVAQSVENPRMDCTTNVFGTLNMLEAARQAKAERFIFASSGAPIGEAEPPIHEELAAHPASPYGASKLAGEGYCSAYARTFGLETVALRFGNVYGPGSGHKNSVVAKFIRDVMTTGILQIYGTGNQTRDFIFIDDLVEAVMLAANAPEVGGEVFQIATERETTVSETAELVSSIMSKFGYSAPKLEYSEARLGDVKRNFSDTTKARQRLGWQSKTSLDRGIEATVRWFASSAEASGIGVSVKNG